MIDRDVELKVGGKAYMLSPTLDAMKKINRQYDSLLHVAREVAQLNFDAICLVIAAGAGISGKQAEVLEAEVFKAGVLNVAKPVGEYLAVLMDPTDAGEEGGSGGKN